MVLHNFLWTFIHAVHSASKTCFKWTGSTSLKLCFSMWECASAQGAQSQGTDMEPFKVCSSVSFKFLWAVNHEVQDDKVTTVWSHCWIRVVTLRLTVITVKVFSRYFFHYSGPFQRAVIHHSIDMWCIRSRHISVISFSSKSSSLVPSFCQNTQFESLVKTVRQAAISFSVLF